MAMTATNSLPDVTNTMPRFLRRMKFLFHPLQYVEDLAKTYGDNFRISNLSGSSIVYFSSPQALQQIFTADSSQLSSAGGPQSLRFLVGTNSLIFLDGDRHQRQRQLLTPPFHGDRMWVYGESIREITQSLCDEWKVNKPFKIRESMQQITLSVILRVIFGLDEGQRFDELGKLITPLLELMGSPLMSSALIFPVLQKDLGAWSPWGRVVRLKEQVDQLIYALIQERRSQSNQNRQDILSLMMSARDQDGQSMSDEELHDELMTLLIAGHETTASALTWAFYWIDCLPQVRDTLQRELDSVGENPDFSVIAKLPYLTAVCQETLRLYPVVMTAFFRVLKSPMEIIGHKLPVGTLIIPSIYLAHHREAVYPQSKQFRPERFLERQFSPYEYLPFGGGNRRCIGMAFAQYEMKLVLATILSRFQVSRVHKRRVRPVRRGLTVAAPAGMRMVATEFV
jgi:cytochrome P450